VLDLCILRKARAPVTRPIVREARTPRRRQVERGSLVHYYCLLGGLEPDLVPLPSLKAIDRAAELVTAKDTHVLAGARGGRATHLITLDRKHLLLKEVRQGTLPLQTGRLPAGVPGRPRLATAQSTWHGQMHQSNEMCEKGRNSIAFDKSNRKVMSGGRQPPGIHDG
jgi:hypothetical protein